MLFCIDEMMLDEAKRARCIESYIFIYYDTFADLYQAKKHAEAKPILAYQLLRVYS